MNINVLKFDGNEIYLKYNDDEYIEYLEQIDDEDAIFHCYYYLVRFSHIPDIDRNQEFEFQKKYIESGRMTLRKYQAIYVFYDTYKLSTTPLCNSSGEIIKDPVYKMDLTEEGVRFAEIAKHWQETKGATKNPPDIKYLEKKLKEMRKK